MSILAQSLNVLLPSAALVAGVWAMLRVLRPNAATRCAAWGGVLVVLALLPLVPFEAEREPLVYLPAAPMPATPPAEAPETAAPAPRASEWDLLEAIPFLYLAGVVLLLGRLGLDYVRLRRITRGARPAPLTCADAGLPFRLRRLPRVLLSEQAQTPFAAGFLRPAIVLPASLPDQLSDSELQHVLLHEMAHIARRDDWTNLLAHLVQALCWPNPFVALVMRRIDSEREQACDDWVVSSTGSAPVSYARSLAKLMEIGVSARRSGREPLLASTMVGGRVTQRVEKLLVGTRTFAPRVSLVKFGMSLVCLAVLGLICVQAPALVSSPSAEAAYEPPQAAASAPASVPPAPPVQQRPQPARGGFLAALADAGYKDLSVDQVIELKNHGLNPEFLRDMTSAGWGKLTPEQLISLHDHSISGKFLQEMRSSGIRDLTLDAAIAMRDRGVRPRTVAEVHSLGFGPYTADEVMELANNGVRPDLFRSLRENGVSKISAAEAIEAARHGLNGHAIQEARKYGPNLTVAQMLKLKRAGVI